MQAELCFDQRPAVVFRSALLTLAVERALVGSTDEQGAEHDEAMIRRALESRRACLDEVRAKAADLMREPVFVALALEEDTLADALMASRPNVMSRAKPARDTGRCSINWTLNPPEDGLQPWFLLYILDKHPVINLP